MDIFKKIENRELKVCVIGLGYVGLPLLKLLNEKKFDAIGLDINKEKISKANKLGLKATLRPKKALENIDCAIVCVPTPIDENHQPDLSYIKSAFKTIANYLRKDMLIIVESTVAPGTIEEILIPILEKSNLKASKDFYVAHCPERLDPGNKKWTIRNIPRVVGGIDEVSTELAYKFYKEIIDAKIIKVSSIKTAEAVKIVENAFRDINIAFVNELAKFFDKIGIDVLEVINAASTKPFGFMPFYPGCGVGGHCIPVDPYYLIEKAKEKGFDHKLLRLAREINNSMPEYTVWKVIFGLNKIGKPVKNARITILGVAYKGGIDDIRNSPSLKIVDKLEKLGAKLTIFDPYVPKFSTVSSVEQALKNCECVVIVTDHPEFKNISVETFKKANIKVIVDGRNVLNKEKIEGTGIIYLGIGRGY